MPIATTIGSMPQRDAHKAVALILENTPHLAAWPQLPRRDWRENMTAQYSESFPGIKFDDSSDRLWVSSAAALDELEKFYEKYLAQDLDYFAISPRAASGIYALKELIGKSKNIKSSALGDNSLIPPCVKCQTAGPITYAMMLKTEDGRSVFFDENLRDVALKTVTMKSVWQIKFFEGLAGVLFLDEPYLSAYGSAFSALARQDIVSALKTVLYDIKAIISSCLPSVKDIKIGVHCCGNTDWTILMESGVDIISFDSCGFFESMLLSPEEEIKKFLGRGGIFAFGAVPTSREEILRQTPATLKERLSEHISALSDKKNIERQKLTRQMLLTPSCGLASTDEETSVKALNYIRALSEETEF